MWSRRQLLIGGCASALVSPLARAGSGLRPFVFVHAPGGWDPTLTFAPLFDDPDVDMDGGVPGEVADIPFVRHELRPNVDRFLRAWGERCVVFNGVEVGALSHELGRRLVCTGSASGAPDWGTRLAAEGSGLALPHLVLAGPSYAGSLGAAIARAGSSGQLGGLVDGSLVSDVAAMGAEAQAVLDAHLAGRAERLAARRPEAALLLDDYRAGLEGSATLRALGAGIPWDGVGWTGRVETCAAALSTGVSRCVSLAWPDTGTAAWDSHVDNATTQSELWDGLFAALHELLEALEAAALDAVVVVLSEMGRAPRENGQGGKDHWPVTSLFACGPALAGGYTVGSWEAGLFGGEVDGAPLTPARIGEQLLAWG